MDKFSKCILQNTCSEQVRTEPSILGWEETGVYRIARRSLQKTRTNVRSWAEQVGWEKGGGTNRNHFIEEASNKGKD